MNGDAIQLVSKALEDFLNVALDDKVTGGVYVGPLDDDDATGHAVVLFLYRIGINADLRNTRHVVPAQTPGGTPTSYDGALPLDLHYLLTGGDSQTGGELGVGLHALGYAMQALNDAPNLVGLAVQGETVRLTLDPVSSEEMSRIWTLFPAANYRTSVAYVASPVWIDPATVRAPGAPVVDESYRAGGVTALGAAP
jgi:hypothetical protein